MNECAICKRRTENDLCARCQAIEVAYDRGSRPEAVIAWWFVAGVAWLVIGMAILGVLL